MTQKTLEVHWGAHHRGYVEALNKHLAKNDLLYGYTMDELIKVTYNNGNPWPEFNSAAQVVFADYFCLVCFAVSISTLNFNIDETNILKCLLLTWLVASLTTALI